MPTQLHLGKVPIPPRIFTTFSNHYQLTRDPGEKYEYSNLGVGLLADALASRAGTDYETLLRTRITGPLQMNRTAVHLTPEMEANLIARPRLSA